MPDGIAIVRLSAHDVVALKPAGMACELSSDPRGVSLVFGLRRMLEGRAVRLPHRLDRVARGLVVAALTDEAIAFHGEQLRLGRWKKHYLARVRPDKGVVVAGVLGLHEAFLKTRGSRTEIVRSGGKPSFLEILAAAPAPERPGEAHLLVRLLTGRRHQIRAMLAAMGLPLVGDPLYGREATRRAVGFYLEHAALELPEYPSGRHVLVHSADDPGRERLAPALAAALAGVVKTR